MNRNFIKQLQTKIIKLLRLKNKPLYLLTKDNCSEISRLAGCWILEKIPDSKIFIAKGRNVMNIKNKCHDILLIEDDNEICIIDPTVWQFFKNKKSILIKDVKDIKTALDVLKDIYKGNWQISEELKKSNCQQKNKWESIVRQNITET